MKTYLVFLIGFTNIFVSCRQKIDSENIMIKDGLYTDSSNGKTLDGLYISVTPIAHALPKKNVVKLQFSRGVPIGEWSDTHGGELIHSGQYLSEENAKNSIQHLTKCKRVDINFWKEVDFHYLTLELIEPTVTDTITLQKVVETSKRILLEKYKFNYIKIDSIGNTKKNYIYECYIYQ